MNRIKLTDSIFWSCSVDSIIDACERVGVCLNKYRDPIEDELQNISADKARSVARDDAGLLWVGGGSLCVLLSELGVEA